MFVYETGFDVFVRRSALILSIVNVALLCLLALLSLPPDQVRIFKLATGVVAVLAFAACMHEIYDSGLLAVVGVLVSAATLIGLLACALGYFG